MEKNAIKVDLPDNLRDYQKAFETAYEEKSVIYYQIQSYFNSDINEILNRKNVTVFDVGANVGLFSMEVLRRTAGQAQIYSFEPVPETYRKLQANLEQFNLPNIHLFNYGLGEDELTVTFMHSPAVASVSSRYDMYGSDDNKMALSMIYNKNLADKFHMNIPGFLRYLPRPVNSALLTLMSYLFRKTIGKSQPVECRITTLSKIVADQQIEKIDLLKIDVEKAELDVLMGISAADWGKINAIVLEVHDIADRENVIRKLLTQHGFNRIVVDKEEEGQRAFGMSGFRDGR